MNRRSRHVDDPALRYTLACRVAAETVISGYSTSFAMASRLLAPATRPHVAAIYALARVADEIVDGGVDGDADGAVGRREADGDGAAGRRGELLDALHAETLAALERGHSANPVVHAFADTARARGIGPGLVEPFFASMRMDLESTVHDRESLARYIHGSAEVIGEMCLRCFADGAVADAPGMAGGARALGAAFQKVNFLRDVREDHLHLRRNYLPGRDPLRLTDTDLHELTADIDRDLGTARASIDRIPGPDRRAVLAAHDVFAELNRRLRAAGAHRVRSGRVRVPDPVKVGIVARAALVARGTGR